MIHLGSTAAMQEAVRRRNGEGRVQVVGSEDADTAVIIILVVMRFLSHRLEVEGLTGITDGRKIAKARGRVTVVA